MKKLVGIIGVCCLLSSAVFIGGCGKSDEGTPPADAQSAPPPDPTKPASKNNPGQGKFIPPPPPVTK